MSLEEVNVVGKKFTAVFTDYKVPIVGEAEMREIAPDEVLLKVYSAPVHFSDRGYSRGIYGSKDSLPPPPVGVGFEGAGEILAVGKDLENSLIGKKAAFSSSFTDEDFQGSFRQFIYLKASKLVLFPKE